MNSIISWVGGKKALRDLIYLRMPKNYDRYIEVFGGGGWVLFGKPPDKCMEVYNDFNSNLANLFYCVKERPMALLRELSFLPLNSRDEFTTLRKFLAMEEFKSEHLAEELEIATHFLKEPEAAEIRDILMERAAVGDVKRAAAFYKIIRYSYGSGCTSYGCQPFDIRKTFTIIWEANRRLKDTVIENKDFEALIRQYDRPNAFFYCESYAESMARADANSVVYCDPPYAPLSATANFTAYHTNSFTLEQQAHLAEIAEGLVDRHIPVLISNHDTMLTREWYQRAKLHVVKVRRSISSNGGTRKKVDELLALYKPGVVSPAKK